MVVECSIFDGFEFYVFMSLLFTFIFWRKIAFPGHKRIEVNVLKKRKSRSIMEVRELAYPDYSTTKAHAWQESELTGGDLRKAAGGLNDQESASTFFTLYKWRLYFYEKQASSSKSEKSERQASSSLTSSTFFNLQKWRHYFSEKSEFLVICCGVYGQMTKRARLAFSEMQRQGKKGSGHRSEDLAHSLASRSLGHDHLAF